MIRAMKQEDVELLKEIHSKFYSSEFEFPDFEKHFLCCFAKVDKDNNIISAGGIRTICEAVAITDKRQPKAIRREALFDMVSASMYIADKYDYNAIHAWIQEAGFKSPLEKVGFKPITGNGLILTF